MNALCLSILLALVPGLTAMHAADFYFGGTGDTNSRWVGYQVAVETNPFTWTAYTLDLARRGRILRAPATFTRLGTNTWTAIFDEHVRRGNSEGYALARRELQISISLDRQSIRVHDGRDMFDLVRISRKDLRVLNSGRIPNPQFGANGKQPSNSGTNRMPAAAASRRSP